MAKKAATTKTSSTKVDAVMKRKLAISAQIHKLRAELAKQNSELVKLGADARSISFW